MNAWTKSPTPADEIKSFVSIIGFFAWNYAWIRMEKPLKGEILDRDIVIRQVEGVRHKCLVAVDVCVLIKDLAIAEEPKVSLCKPTLYLSLSDGLRDKRRNGLMDGYLERQFDKLIRSNWTRTEYDWRASHVRRYC